MPDRLRRQRRHARLENPQATAPVPVTAGRQPAARGLLALCLLAAVPLCIGLAVSVVLFLLVSVSLYARFAGTLPAGYRLDAGQLSQSTKIYDRRGTLLYEVFDPQGGKRTLVTAEQLPQTLKQAVVATEDSSFYS